MTIQEICDQCPECGDCVWAKDEKAKERCDIVNQPVHP